jgi:hypothetical protein
MTLTEKAGNPASRLRGRYAELMRIGSVETLVAEATKVADGPGFSPGNLAKFKHDLGRSARGGLTHVQSFLTNFMLAADGLRVLKLAS